MICTGILRFQISLKEGSSSHRNWALNGQGMEDQPSTHGIHRVSSAIENGAPFYLYLDGMSIYGLRPAVSGGSILQGLCKLGVF